jgi:hypothetical protein
MLHILQQVRIPSLLQAFVKQAQRLTASLEEVSR